MAIVLTNGKFFISHNKSGRIIKIKELEEAQDFHTVQKAIEQKKKAPGKTSGYYFMDTDMVKLTEMEKNQYKRNRKRFSTKERVIIYRKTNGHCYLCGEFVDFDKFEIEHQIPISRGGTNCEDNLFCACHICNRIKNDIYPQDFIERVSNIFLYQMQQEHKNEWRWKVIHRILKHML